MLHVPHLFSERTPTSSCEPASVHPYRVERSARSDGASSSAFGKDKPSIAGERAANDKTYEFSKISSKHLTPSTRERSRQADLPRKGRPFRRRIPRWARPPLVTRSRMHLADAPFSTGAPRARCLDRASLHLPPRRTRLPSEEARSRRPSPSTMRRATIESCPSPEEPLAEASSHERARRLRLLAPHRLSLRHTDRNTT